ncbi:putative F-box domain-containing protein [Lupinus albus]|uniref:Putative F-box domain-containing protein n=1 Tax=Lupinus albus TaxID=3870 RepID=A0A6A4QVZ4_LUPAL|nr:putative F-box domain-containing protein [Lupinus albus]
MSVTVETSDSKKRRFDAPPSPVEIAAIPYDLIIDILSRIPVKSLLRFKCVCKSWKTLISDTQFAKFHFQRSITDSTFTHHRLMPQACFLRDDIVSCSVESLLNDYDVIPESLGYPLHPHYDVVGYRNGLCCLMYNREKVRLWNPCTKLVSPESPSLFNRDGPNRKTVFGFGYDESSNTYKVVSFFVDHYGKSLGSVFSFGSENCNWRQVHGFPDVTPEWGKSGECARGTLNWLAKAPLPGGMRNDKYYVIVSFDLGNETCREFLLPHDIDRSCSVGTTFGVLRDCLCVSQNYELTNFIVWQMMEHGVKESWTRLLNISYVDLGLKVYAFLEPLCMSEKGDILMNTNIEECKVVLYNPGDNRLERHKIFSKKSWFRSKIYVESLVSPPC